MEDINTGNKKKKNEANKTPNVLVSVGSGTRRKGGREEGDGSTGLFQFCLSQRRRKSGQSGAQSRLSHGVGELHEVSACKGRGSGRHAHSTHCVSALQVPDRHNVDRISVADL